MTGTVVGIEVEVADETPAPMILNVTRSFAVGEDDGRAAVLGECRRIHELILAACRPGMPASELFRHARSLLTRLTAYGIARKERS